MREQGIETWRIITSAASPGLRSLLGRQDTHHPRQPNLADLLGMKASSQARVSWSHGICHQGEFWHMGISQGQMGNMAFQMGKRSPSQNPGWLRRVKEAQAADPCVGWLLPFAGRWRGGGLCLVKKLTTICYEFGAVLDFWLTRACQLQPNRSCYEELTLVHGAPNHTS